MAREVSFTRTIESQPIEASINYDEAVLSRMDAVSPWTISIHAGAADMGRLVGFEGEGQNIIGMHHLKPDPGAKRAVEITVFRVNDDLRARKLDADVFVAFERWLLKRGWRGNILKKVSRQSGTPIRNFADFLAVVCA
jgi:hypothetical protein